MLNPTTVEIDIILWLSWAGENAKMTENNLKTITTEI